MSNTESADTQWNEMARTLGFEDETSMWLQLYIKERRPIAELAKTLGYGTATIARRIAVAGVMKRTRGGPNASGKTASLIGHLDQRWVRMSYPKEVAEVLGVSSHSVYRVLKEERV
jgi:hypothetical protein